MIGVRALILCEAVRVETDGTLTIIGMYNERLVAPPGEGPLEIPGLTVLAVLTGLTGATSIEVRHRIRHVEDRSPIVAIPFLREAHDPHHDEHNMVFAHGPMVVAAGGHELTLELGTVTKRYRFNIVRRVAPI